MNKQTSKNDITGDKIQTKPSTKQYRDGFDAIFGEAGYSKPTDVCCGKSSASNGLCSPCSGHNKEQENDREVQESK